MLMWLLLWQASCGAWVDDSPGQTASTRCSSSAYGLLITEIMPDPVGPDAGHEWLELHNSGPEPVCLDGAMVHIGLPWATKTRTLHDVGCLAPGAFWLLSNGSGEEQGSWLQPHASYGALMMPNTQGAVAVSCDGTTLDAMEYGPAAAAPAPKVGRALARVPMTAEGSFCLVSGEADAAGNIGSPGLPNPGCATCRDAFGVLRPLQPATPGALELLALTADDASPAGHSLLLRAGAQDVDLAGLSLHALRPGRPGRRWQVPEGHCHVASAHSVQALSLLPQAPSRLAAPQQAFVGSASVPRGMLQLQLQHGKVPIASGQWQSSAPQGCIEPSTDQDGAQEP